MYVCMYVCMCVCCPGFLMFSTSLATVHFDFDFDLAFLLHVNRNRLTI